jgi:hypothetical protein
MCRSTASRIAILEIALYALEMSTFSNLVPVQLGLRVHGVDQDFRTPTDPVPQLPGTADFALLREVLREKMFGNLGPW